MRTMVAGRAELSRSLFVARSRDVIGMERDWCGPWWLGGLSSRSLFVARSRDVIGMERDWCGAWWRGGLSSHGICWWHGVVTSSGWRGTGAEHDGGER